MILISSKVAKGMPDKHLVWCPGCDELHGLAVDSKERPSWTWNGDPDKPTYSPSLLVRGQTQCHSFIRDGQWIFLNDCDHPLAGKTVPIPDLPDWIIDGIPRQQDFNTTNERKD